jgi:hypothetical protein
MEVTHAMQYYARYSTRQGQPRDLVTWSQVQPAVIPRDSAVHDPFANRKNHKPACKRKQTKHTQRIERCCAYSERYLRSPSGVHVHAHARWPWASAPQSESASGRIARAADPACKCNARAAEGHHYYWEQCGALTVVVQ